MTFARCHLCGAIVDTVFNRDGRLTSRGYECDECIGEARAKAEAEDERLDDPRHGQAAHINRMYS